MNIAAASASASAFTSACDLMSCPVIRTVSECNQADLLAKIRVSLWVGPAVQTAEDVLCSVQARV